ncbi:hypothetical protein MLD38_028377 [Melastoma candidum]|uniref:Uncharacterized protein n=1 Tax=Melastoma candidum TaxID=119954 RepID=A0ACB9N331_9MYRT|nr:hypothetical protein MLD38_028377 [Melastoma candidum]
MEVEKVQVVASSFLSKGAIPAEYIRPEQEQPSVTTYHGPVPTIPTVDLGDADREGLVRAVAAASREWGLFQVVNHGIPAEVIVELQRVGKEFFELPAEEKEKYASPPGSQSLEGYGTQVQKEIDGKKSWVDHLFNKVWPPSSIDYKYWPTNPPAYREANEEYVKHIRKVANKLFGCLSQGLGLEEDAMKKALGGDDLQYNLKINYYPPCPRPDLALGVPPHTDLCALTLLVPNEIPGLQVLKDRKWYDAAYIPNALIVHIGDQVEILSNGEYRSVVHRTTVNKEKARMSWPVFLEPPMDWVVGPLPQLLTNGEGDDQGSGNPPKYKAKKFRDYMHCKLNKLPQ